MKGVNML